MDALLASPDVSGAYVRAMTACSQGRNPQKEDAETVYNAIAFSLIPRRAYRASSLGESLPRPVRILCVVRPLAKDLGWRDFSLNDLAHPSRDRFSYHMQRVEEYLAFAAELRAQYAGILRDNKKSVEEEQQLKADIMRKNEELSQLGTEVIQSSAPTERAALRKRRDSLAKDVQTRKESIARAKDRLPERINKLHTLRRDISTLRPAVEMGPKRLHETVRELREEVGHIKSEINAKEMMLGRASLMLENLDQIDKLLTTLLDFKAKISQAEARIDSAGESKLLADVETAKRELEEQKDVKRKLEESLKLKEVQLVDLDQRIKDCREQQQAAVHDLNEREAHTNQTLGELKEKTTAIKTQLAEIQPLIRLKKQFVDGPLAAQEQACRDLAERLALLESQLESII